LQCVAVCCSVLQCVAVCCSVLQQGIKVHILCMCISMCVCVCTFLSLSLIFAVGRESRYRSIVSKYSDYRSLLPKSPIKQTIFCQGTGQLSQKRPGCFQNNPLLKRRQKSSVFFKKSPIFFQKSPQGKNRLKRDQDSFRRAVSSQDRCIVPKEPFILPKETFILPKEPSTKEPCILLGKGLFFRKKAESYMNSWCSTS